MAIRLDKDSRGGSFLLSCAALLLRWLLGLLGSTWRIELVAGHDTLETLVAEKKPHILSFWHNRIFPAAYFLSRNLVRRGFPITLLTSQSRDGELVTRLVAGWGVQSVRGSSTRGGREALRAIYRSITRDASSPLVVPDGPKGPIYEFKAGALVLAQMSGAPILLMGFAASSCWRIKSWDRLIVPRPFSRVVVKIAAPEYLEKDLNGEAFENERRRLETQLSELTGEAEALASR